MKTSRVLELRIHGIANTPPADMLCSTGESIERNDGDEQGAFWRVKVSASALSAPSTVAPENVEVITEAYSWGNQARSGVGGVAPAWRAVVHLGWLLVLPFGLCNLAYWARRDIRGQNESQRADGTSMVRVFALLQTLFYTVGLMTASVYLIGLQCYVPGERVCAALPVALDFLAGWSATARAAFWSVIPIAAILFVYFIVVRARGNFHPDRSFSDEGLSRRQRKDEKPADPPRPPLLASTRFWQRDRAAQIAERTHLAAVFSLVTLLLAADALLDSTGLDLFELPRDLETARVKAPVPLWVSVIGLLLLVSAILMVFALSLRGNIEGDRVGRRVTTLVVVCSVFLYLFWCVWAIGSTRDAIRLDQFSGDGAFEGLISVPGTIAALGGLIAVASLSWGFSPGYRLFSWVFLSAAIVGVAVAESLPTDDSDAAPTRAWISITAVVMVALTVGVSYVPVLKRANRDQSRVVGWHGNGAAVALLIAWFTSLVITTLLVLGVHKWLTTDADSPVVDSHWRTFDDDSAIERLPLPEFYERFAGFVVIIVIALVVTAISALAAAQRRYPALSLPEVALPAGDAGEKLSSRDRYGNWGGAERLVPPSRNDGRTKRTDTESMTRGRRGRLYGRRQIPWNEYPTSEIRPSGRLRAVVEARMTAGLLQRGESLMRVLAILTAMTLIPLAIPWVGEWFMEFQLMAALVGVSGWLLGLLALAAVAWVITNAVTSTVRPLGLVWDIICFFPRAGHPFSPPCYSERAVPEIKKRILRFLKEEREAGNEPYVVLSAHSMGAAIAVATIFSLYEEAQERWSGIVAPSYDPTAGSILREPGPTEAGEGDPGVFQLHRLALLTHGVQLRAYFSRFFPEVLGPRVLGVPGTRGPALLGLDPWKKQVVDEARNENASIGADDDPPTIVSLLGGEFGEGTDWVAPRWRSLWRRTDPLGFPVFGHWSHAVDGAHGNPIDRGATEHSPRSYLWTVAQHSDYLSTPQYQVARDELVIALMQPDAPMASPVAASLLGRFRAFCRAALL